MAKRSLPTIAQARRSPRLAARLDRLADRMLAKSGYFSEAEEHDENEPVDPAAISSGGHLRPTWQGKA